MVQKLRICEKVYFFYFQILLLLFLHTLLLCHILLFGCWIFSIPSGYQTVWIQIRPDIRSGLILVQTVCKGYQQTTRVAPSGKDFTKQLVSTTLWLKPWQKLISFGSNFFNLATVLASTNSEPGLALQGPDGCLARAQIKN